MHSKSHFHFLFSFSRNHPLARHTDILTCIETRISMLSMTYSKYIDLNLCCFIPGKVIDEVYNIFKLIKYDTKPLRAHEVLQELRDISSMAIEHFDEKIANGLKKSYMSASPGRLSVAGCELNHSSRRFFYSISCIFLAIGSGSDLLHLTPPSLSVDDMGEVMPRRCDGENNCRQARMNKMALVRMETKYKNAIKKVRPPTELIIHYSFKIQITTQFSAVHSDDSNSEQANASLAMQFSKDFAIDLNSS